MASREKPGAMFNCFKRMFPNLDAMNVAQPARTQLLGTMCHVLQYAWAAYEDPKVDGYKEETLHGQQICHLNSDTLDGVVEGVIRIQLKDAKNVADAEYGWWNMSDPYVVFSAGIACAKSEVVKDSSHPVWNSTHYIIIKKRYARSDFDGKLNVALFDKDTQSGFLGSIASYMNRDDHLGSAQIDLAELKKPGRHSFDLEIKKETGSGKKKTTVRFTAEFISFQQACEEQGCGKESGKWIKDHATTDNALTHLSKLESIVQIGQITFSPLAYIDTPATETQAWMYVGHEAKALLISYRGTETDKRKDVLLDFTAYKRTLGEMSEDHYVFKPEAALRHPDIRIHSGFGSAYDSIREAVLQLSYDVTGWNADWLICLTGHSLGGALATLCRFECVNRKNPDGSGPEVGLMNVGAPRVGNSVFASLYNDTFVDSFRVVDKFDPVHLVPPFYVHTAKEVVCQANGDVYVEGVLLKDLDPKTLVINSRELDVDVDDSGSLEDIIEKYGRELDDMAEKHMSQNYAAIIGKAVTNFFGMNG